MKIEDNIETVDDLVDGSHSEHIERAAFPDRLPILAVPRPVFPKVMVPIELESPELKRLVKDVTKRGHGLVGLALEKEPSDPERIMGGARVQLGEGEVYELGVIAQIVNVSMDDDGEVTAIITALDRMRIVKVVSQTPYLTAEVEYPKEKGAPSDELRAYTLAVINSIKELVLLNPLYKEQLSLLISEGNLEEPGPLADMAAFLTSAKPIVLQGVLETMGVRKRLEKVLGLLKDELEISRLQTRIRERIEDRIDEQQRDFFLREQLKAIKQELGIEKEGKESEVEEFQGRLLNKTLSVEAQGRVDEEMAKLRMIEPSSSEYNITRNYLDWLTLLPWGVHSEDKVDLRKAQRVLDREHYGLGDVKERIIEFIAEGILREDFGGSIICLTGPPGVGKTSIGKSIASCLGRKFYRFSLGGMRDEAEIKGHRRTYIGAMPGKFLQALKVCATDNPVIMLDEVDKIGASYHGDPASALLEVLDPEQNRDFLDHYLDVRFDLSKVMFVCTANQTDTIPSPLLDRMEMIQLSGYILEEKLEIASRYLLPRALTNLKQPKGKVTITKPALHQLIDGYAREAGLRNLDNQIKKIVRKCAVKLVKKEARVVHVTPESVESFLGAPVFTTETAFANPLPGVVMGLAWTSMGGDTLFIEATAVKSEHRGYKQTGQLGKVMIESSEIAHTTIRGLCRSLGNHFFDEHFIHLHVPAGAVPKDGPSAGITMALALYSLALRTPVKPGVAMTGELNLSGLVMPVGGIREKLIAARRAKVTEVILPIGNRSDYQQLPKVVKRHLKVRFAETFEQVAKWCLAGIPGSTVRPKAVVAPIAPPAKKASKRVAKKTSKRVAKKASKRVAKKASKRVAKKASKRVAKKASKRGPNSRLSK
jgi:ATP-dependent Lon protease